MKEATFNKITLGMIIVVCGVILAASCSLLIQTDKSDDKTGSSNPTTPTTPSNPGDVTLVTNRTSGVAPLSVHISAEYPVGTDPAEWFHQYEYRWDFGDSSSGTWAPTGLSRNTATGAITAHVFDKPGSYPVSLTVKKAGTVIATTTVSITVQDPDVFYAGTKTICVNPAGDPDFSGAPTGATQIQTNDLSTITQYGITGNRILFKRGASWTTEGLTWPDAEQGTLGAYGPGVNPDAYGIYANNPKITVTSDSFFPLDFKHDWRIMDLHMIDSTRQYGFIGGAEKMSGILLYRIKTKGFSTGIGWSHWNNPDGLTQIDDMAIVSCDVSDTNEISSYVGSERLTILGSRFADDQRSHALRVWQAYKSVISNNVMSGSSLGTDMGRQALKLHGPMEEEVTSTGWDRMVKRSEYIIISDNIFGTCGPWPVCIGPQNDASDERLSNIVFERNRYTSDFGNKSPASLPLSIALQFAARQVTIRNNIIDGSNWGNEFTGIYLSSSSIAPEPKDVWIYNNTIYRSGNGMEWAGIWIQTGSSSVIVRNNILSLPNASTGNVLLRDEGTGTVQSNNIFNGTVTFADPANSNPLIRSFALSSTSTDAVNKGYALDSVFEDFTGYARPVGSLPDIGAYEYH